jgi:dTMP kinase
VFITFEGPEGSGKTTQITLLAATLRAAGLAVVATREPGGTPLGEQVRALLLDTAEPISAEAEAYLMTAARAEHVRRVIQPALRDGAIVISDRFVDSTLAYQGAGRGLPIAELRDLQRLAIGSVLPDLTFLIDIDVHVGLARRRMAKDMNRIDLEQVAFHERVAGWFRDAALSETQRWVMIDGTGDAQAVQAAVYRAVQQRMPALAIAAGEESRR